MAYKLGLLLSFVFMMSVMLFAGDLLCVSQIHSALDSIALTVSYRVAKEGMVSDETKDFVRNSGAEFIPVTSGTPSLGETYEFIIAKRYKPIIMSKNETVISVKRSTVIGFYDSYY